MLMTREQLKELIRNEVKAYKAKQTPPLEEGWKENLMATIMAVASTLGGVKGMNKTSANTDNVQTQMIQNPEVVIPFSSAFQSGKYLPQSMDNRQMSIMLEKLGEFLMSHPGADIEINIHAGESQVPNRDAESGGGVLKRGELASKRAQSIETVLQNAVNVFRKNGANIGKINFVQPEIKIGETPYKQGDSPRDPKFTKEQYVDIHVKVKSETPKQTVTPAKSEWDGNRYESIYNSNGALIGTLYYKVQRGPNSDMLFVMIGKDGKPTGEKHVIPSDWRNKNIGPSTTWGTNVINKIRAEL